LEWQAKDPLNNLEHELKSLKPNMFNILEDIKSEINLEVKAAIDFAERSPFPKQSEAYDGVYA
jgi:TPP-dependent pyruvate/acetoin dehydrogenase alpha subunit